jgi:hypothetical protein
VEFRLNLANRFERRMANANFIAAQVKSVEQNFTHVIFIHVSILGWLIYLCEKDYIFGLSQCFLRLLT